MLLWGDIIQRVLIGGAGRAGSSVSVQIPARFSAICQFCKPQLHSHPFKNIISRLAVYFDLKFRILLSGNFETTPLYRPQLYSSFLCYQSIFQTAALSCLFKSFIYQLQLTLINSQFLAIINYPESLFTFHIDRKRTKSSILFKMSSKQ